VAKKCGILEEEKELDSMALQQYLNMYKIPLSEEAMEAITQFSEVAAESKKKKNDKKKYKCAIIQDNESKKKKNKKLSKSSSNAAFEAA
jgi:hypothetical protein